MRYRRENPAALAKHAAHILVAAAAPSPSCGAVAGGAADAGGDSGHVIDGHVMAGGDGGHVIGGGGKRVREDGSMEEDGVEEEEHGVLAKLARAE